MDRYIRVTFADVITLVPKRPGLYEIYTLDGIALKVGISSNLRKRLIQHGESKQKYLLCTSGDWSDPNSVTSKRSILTKHLYFSQADGYDLKLESDRRRFLKQECYILFLATASREEARDLERRLEAEGKFQFVGRARNTVVGNL
ncbi:hypothetical protein Meth11DRAFT_2629 [Methylophilaceae bacterium 11]|jgi:hypothetical protein|nr:hypothetical protein Meth11DRAFT_2629 [Methylophilaceae bacterium 11]